MNLEAVYGDGNRTATATLAIPVQGTAGPALWSQLYGPNVATHMLEINQPVILDIDATCHGLEIVPGGSLTFDPAKSLLLRVDGHSLCVEGGALDLTPASAGVKHEIRFVNIDEAAYLPGSEGDHHTNPGLCVMDPGGTLTLKGAAKRAWCRATGPLAKGAQTVTVEDATGWRAGDEIVITPTEPATVTNHHTHFDRTRIQSVTGNTVTLTAPLAWPHPTNTAPDGTVIAAEVVNLTRNVVVSGDTETGTLGAVKTQGRSQVMFMGPQIALDMSYVELVHLGPRQVVSGKTYTDVVLGRYGLHWHKMGDATRGTLVEGVSAHDLGSRAFVPHASHGITFKDCVAWGYFDAGYWWDTTDNSVDATDDILYDRCFAGLAKFDPANGLGGLTNTGFLLPAGLRTAIRHSVATAITGRTNASGYHWPEQTNLIPNNVWVFEDCDTHNNQVDGTFVWQNDINLHHVTRLRTWNNTEAGVDHGAYKNAYQYDSVQAWGNKLSDFMDEAQSRLPSPTESTGTDPIRVTGGWIGKLTIGTHRTVGNQPVVFRNVTIGSVDVNEKGNSAVGAVDIVDCGITPTLVTRTLMLPGSVVRVQQAGQAWRITSTGVTSIPTFA